MKGTLEFDPDNQSMTFIPCTTIPGYDGIGDLDIDAPDILLPAIGDQILYKSKISTVDNIRYVYKDSGNLKAIIIFFS